MLFRNFVPGLLRVDCQGEVRPGLIETWAAEPDGSWVFTLRDQARFPSGRLLSVADVVATLAPAVGAKAPGIDSAVALNDHQLRVFAAGGQDSLLRALADPSLALIAELASEHPVGAGSIDVPAWGTLPVIEFRFSLRGDARDALDRGADLIVTRDPALVDYVARRPEFTTFVLPWSRTYVLLEPAQADPLGLSMPGVEPHLLAQDAVTADARAAEPPYWWRGATSCSAETTAGAIPASQRIAYVRGDDVGRSLAERLVALAGSETSLRSVALDQPQFDAALRQGSERAFVVGLPRQTLIPCRDMAALPHGARITPLIDSRAHAIVRRGAPPLSVEWDGTVRVMNP